MTYDTNGIFRCYEIKSSVSDFRSKNGHNFVGDYGYYVMPEEIYPKVKDDIPEHIGVFTLMDNGYLVSVKKAKKQIAENSDILLQSLLRSVYREAEKVIDSNEKPLINEYKIALARLKRELKNSRQTEHHYRQEIVDLRRVLRANNLNPSTELDKLQEK